jgi:hypothetical protein
MSETAIPQKPEALPPVPCFDLCPRCDGVPMHPEVEGCKGCALCDYTGMREAFDRMVQLKTEAFEAYLESEKERAAYIKAGVCSQCGACNQEQAEKRCTASRDITDEYSCAGDDLWPDDQNTPAQPPR